MTLYTVRFAFIISQSVPRWAFNSHDSFHTLEKLACSRDALCVDREECPSCSPSVHSRSAGKLDRDLAATGSVLQLSGIPAILQEISNLIQSNLYIRIPAAMQWTPSQKAVCHALASTWMLLAAPQIVSAQIATDGTVGPAIQLSGPVFTIDDGLGARVGDNLFHSFSAFNIHAGETARFTGPESINNVISRVTGGSTSHIDGLLHSEIGDAVGDVGILANGGVRGRISIQAGRLEILGGAGIVVADIGGDTGVIEITADDIVIDSLGSDMPTGVFADAPLAGDAEFAGTIHITTGNLLLRDNGSIRSVTRGAAIGGSVEIEAVSITLNGSGTAEAGIIVDTLALVNGGAAGNISIVADRVSIRTANPNTVGISKIVSSTINSGTAGTNTVETNVLHLDALLYLRNGMISTSIRTGGDGNGGNVFIDPINVVLNRSAIAANAFGGNGGNISIITRNFLRSTSSTIQASSQTGIQGNIVVSSPETDVLSGLTPLS